MRLLAWAVIAVGCVCVRPVFADDSPSALSKKPTIVVSGYVETFYQWNFNEPSNFITNFRGYDNRHNTFSIQNAVVDAQGTLGPVTARVALQVGNAPEAYYAAEPVWKATNGAGPSNPDVWKFIQQANLAYVAPVGRGLTIDAGIFLTPIGPEVLAVKDSWNWSRSNVFFGLPAYHSGIRATYPLTDRWTASLQLYNGWNNIVDDNVELSPAAQIIYSVPALTFSALYFGGVERPDGAPEGRGWRNLFDMFLMLHVRKWVSTLFHFDAGFEPNNFGVSAWAAGAVYIQFKVKPWLYLSARADTFYESIPTSSLGTAAPIFWGGSHYMSSGTATIDVRPNENLSVRLEYRHDETEKDLFFQGQVMTDATGNYIPNARTQNTLTLGGVAWF